MARPVPIGAGSALLATLISILWGGNLVSLKIGMEAVPAFWNAFWRMLLGTAVVAVWARRSGVAVRPARGEWLPLLWLGLMFTVQIGLLNSGTVLTSPGYGVVILNSYAIFANLFGHFVMPEDRLTPRRVLGLALSVAGVCVLAVGRPERALAPDPLLGNLILVLSAMLLGVRQVYTRWLVQKVDPARTVVWQMLWSIPLFLAVAVATEPVRTAPVGWRHAAAILYQGVVVAGGCFVGWAALLKKHSAGTLSMFAFIVPVAGIALSGLIFGEAIRANLAAGSALVLAGVLLVTRE